MRLQDVEVPVFPLDRMAPVIGPDRTARLCEAAEEAAAAFAGRRIWNVSSTASGGGVAEMLQVLVGYGRGAGLDVRWTVLHGDAPFFAITKRIHNHLHGSTGDGGELGEAESSHYREVLEGNAALLRERVEPGDIVLLHDPQTAGLVAAMKDHGALVVWRCHVGADEPDEVTERAWSFLRPHLGEADGYVFSRSAHVPAGVDEDRVTIIPPSIDPFGPKNHDLDPETVDAILAVTGLESSDGPSVAPTFTRRDGESDQVRRPADTVGTGQLPGAGVPLVVQVSRWDRLKDMLGVMDGFADAARHQTDAHLALVGPAVAGVTDDPEGGEVLEECLARWRDLEDDVRSRITLVCLPMDDVDENAAMVNALQRRAAIVVQKSLAEGFGLTVAEAMWKARPVVASAVGGIVDQVTDDTGVLLPDPRDLDALAAALRDLLGDPDRAAALGSAARARVQDDFLGDRHLLQYAALFAGLLEG